jgi:hypothetical protein
MFVLVGYGVIPAHADMLNVPASAALINGAYGSPNCSVILEPNYFYGIKAFESQGTCDVQIPVQVPVGHSLQQIEIIYGATDSATLPLLSTNLGTLDYSAFTMGTQFTWTSNLMPGGALHTTRLMQQTKFGYPDAFVVQGNLMYQVFVHLEDGAYLTGLRITYQ